MIASMKAGEVGSGLTVATLPRTSSGDWITWPPATNSLSFPFNGRRSLASVTAPSLEGNSTVAPVPVRMCRRSIPPDVQLTVCRQSSAAQTGGPAGSRNQAFRDSFRLAGGGRSGRLQEFVQFQVHGHHAERPFEIGPIHLNIHHSGTGVPNQA